MITFEAELSASSLEALITKLDKYAKSLDEATTDINKAIAERAEELVKTNVHSEAYDEGDLEESIQSEYNSEYARVYTENDHAAYAEFGIGIVGEGSHPEALAKGWVYDKNAHGDKGWFYTDKNGKKWFTRGYTGRKYMYNSYITLKQELNDIAKDVLKRKELI